MDDEFTIFFDTSPWEGTVSAQHVAGPIAELETMRAKADPRHVFSDDALYIISAMLEVARAALPAGQGIEVS
ncbi:MAG: hypothetical protein KKI08_11245 [Armatimonadetes bacterium]|nr:hypothetical protein [Armatimonadota bacterium]